MKMLPVDFTDSGNTSRRQLSLATRRELIQAIAERYRTANRTDKQKILDEFTEVTGFHRKHAIRALRQQVKETAKPPRSRIYDEAIVQALTILWEATDRICGKRLRQRFRSCWRRWSGMDI